MKLENCVPPLPEDELLDEELLEEELLLEEDELLELEEELLDDELPGFGSPGFVSGSTEPPQAISPAIPKLINVARPNEKEAPNSLFIF